MTSPLSFPISSFSLKNLSATKQTTPPTSPSSQHNSSFCNFSNHNNIAFVFWLKFYSRFSILSKQIYQFFLIWKNFKMLIFYCIFLWYMYFVWVFTCCIVFSQTNLLYGFMILYMLWFVLDFIKLYLFVNCWNLYWIIDLDVLWWNK